MDTSGTVRAGLNKIIFSTKPTGFIWATLSQIQQQKLQKNKIRTKYV